jgi:hypothetical protein
MEVQTLDIIKGVGEAGSIGLLALYMFISFWKDKLYNKTINNHLAHMEIATKENSESNIKLSSALSNLSTVIQGCPNNKLNSK